MVLYSKSVTCIKICTYMYIRKYLPISNSSRWFLKIIDLF